MTAAQPGCAISVLIVNTVLLGPRAAREVRGVVLHNRTKLLGFSGCELARSTALYGAETTLHTPSAEHFIHAIFSGKVCAANIQSAKHACLSAFAATKQRAHAHLALF